MFIEQPYSLSSLLDILGFVQGITLGVLIIILNKRQQRSTLFLGLFLIFFSLKLFYYITKDPTISSDVSQFFLLPFNFSWLLFPLFFVYTQQVSIFSNQATRYWVLYPGLLVFLLQVVLFYQSYEDKLALVQSPWYELGFTYLGILYAWGIGLWNLKLLNRHRREVGNYFSFLEFKELNWARIFLIYSLLSSVIIHILYFVSPNNNYFKILFSVIDLVAIYWISYYGIVQLNVPSFMANIQKESPARDKDGMTYSAVLQVAEQDMEPIMQRIDAHMISAERFVHTELTIVDLAKELDLHPKKISTVINTVRGANFNGYVNAFRIKKAKLLLLNHKDHGHLSIEGIGNEAGFKSKSAFYTAFKKLTGMTPTRFKEKAHSHIH